MVNLGCSAYPVAFCCVLCNLTDYVVPVYSSCDCLSPLVISLRAIMLQSGDFFYIYIEKCHVLKLHVVPCRILASTQNQSASLTFVFLNHSYDPSFIFSGWFLSSRSMFFSRTSVWHVRCPKKCLRLIGPSTVNLIPQCTEINTSNQIND